MNKPTADGSNFDSFLEEEGIKAEVEATAASRVAAWETGKTSLKLKNPPRSDPDRL